MDIRDIEDWIYDLEHDTSADFNVVDLAALYIIRDHNGDGLKTVVDGVSDEINDVLPAFNKYKDKKRRQQLRELPEDACLDDLSRLCCEIKEMIIAIYSGTTLAKERRMIFNMIKTLHDKYSK